MKRLYFLISYLVIFGFYSHGESFNIKAQITFFIFFLINFFTASFLALGKKIVKTHNVLFGMLILFIFFYSIFQNGIKFKVLTDIIQLLNIFFISQVVKKLTLDELENFLKISIIIALFAGIYSYFFYGLIGKRFAPVSYVVPIITYYYYLREKSKLKKIIIILSSFVLILISGRRANLILSLIGMLFVLFIFRKRLAYTLSFIVLAIFLNKDHVFDYLGESQYPTLKRLSYLSKDDQSMDTRYSEVKTITEKFSKENSVLVYLFGFGAAEYYNFQRLWDLKYETRHHIHFSPMNLYFRHGIVGVFFILIVLYKLLRLILKKKNDFSKLVTILIVMTIIDSMFRSLFVEFYGILFIGISLTLNKLIDFETEKREIALIEG